MWRKIKKIILYIVSVVVILLATLVALIETRTGSQWVVKKLAYRVGIELGEVKGNLRQGLDIGWIKYKTGKLSVDATNMSFRWNPAALLYTAVSIDSLSLDRVKIELADSQSESPTAFNQWPTLGLPLRVELKKFNLNNIEIVKGEYHDQWENFSGSLSLGTFHLRYTPLKLLHSNYQLTLEGKTELGFPYATSAVLNWQFQADTRYQGITKIEGDLENVISQTQLKLPLAIDAEMSAPLVDENQYLQAAPLITTKIQVPKQHLPDVWWVQGKSTPSVELNLVAQGNWQSYSGKLTGNLLLEGLPQVDIILQAKGDIHTLAIEQMQITESREEKIDRPVSKIQLNGNVQWSPALKWNLQAKADDVDAALLVENWPTHINASFYSEGEKKTDYWEWKVDDLQAEGSVRDLAFSLSGDLYQNEKEWRSQGLQLTWGANRLDINGYLAEESKVEWNLRAPMLYQISDSLSGNIESKGVLSGSWSLPKVTMDAKGENISWKNFAIKELHLDLSPKLMTTMENRTQMEPVQKSAIINQNYSLDFKANQLQINENTFKSINISGGGSLLNHQLNAVVRHNRFGKLEFSLVGKWLEEKWIGNLESLALKIKKVPKWWLSSQQSVVVSSGQVEINSLCFTTRSNQTAIIDSATQIPENTSVNTPFYLNASAVNRSDKLLAKESHPRSYIPVLHAPELCINGDWQQNTGLLLNVDINAVPLRQFYALFKPEVFFAGVMDGYLRINSPQLDLASTKASLHVETRNAELRYQFEGGITEVYPWRYASISSQLENSQLSSVLKMDWSDFGSVSADNLINFDKHIISGKFQSEFRNLEPLETLLPFTDKVKGNLDADIQWQGDLLKPQFFGQIKLDEASARIPRLGLSLSKMSMVVSANNSSQLNLNLAATSGKGDIQLKGLFVNPMQDNWQLTADLTGNDFQIINLLTVKASLNPTINLQANSQLIKLSGEAEIPYLSANIKTLPQTSVQVSDDVVVIDEKSTVAQTKTIPLSANLRLRLGNDVKFNGFGLDSQLTGDLKLNKEPDRPWVTNGFVAVKEGSYQAYGQALTIGRGRLIFQGDYENPGLDISAFRVIDDDQNTKVILEISGSLQRPKAEVRSEPAHSDSDAMMMLLTGKPLSEASKADASLLIAALGGMGVERGQMITQDIAQFFGVDEVAIKSDKGIDQSQLWIGKYITPKILVRYVVGLFDQAFSLGVVYRLTDKVRIEAESGETQSVDIIYKIER